MGFGSFASNLTSKSLLKVLREVCPLPHSFLYAITDTENVTVCTNPITDSEGNTFACRVCNDCVNARKNDWIARAMAEKETMGNAMVLMLSYRNNPDGTPPAGAEVFRYKDVQNFLMRVRKAYKAVYGTRGDISYIVAGERGSKRDRVHYHMVLFSKRPLSRLGEWANYNFKPIDGPTMDVNCIWSLWPHGLVHPQTPDQGGMAYVMKYALKDMFNVVKSEGTARITRAENHASSIFRQSRKPPIGWRWVDEKLDEWAATLSVPISLNLKPKEYSGFWYPKGKIRDYILQFLHDINEVSKQEKGRASPQMNSLLATLQVDELELGDLDKPTDWEKLKYGERQIKTARRYIAQRSFEDLKQKLFEQQGQYDTNSYVIRRQCGGIRPCKRCREYLNTSDQGRREIEGYATLVKELYASSGAEDGAARWWTTQRRIHPSCAKQLDPEWRDAFKARGD